MSFGGERARVRGWGWEGSLWCNLSLFLYLEMDTMNPEDYKELLVANWAQI